MAEAEFELASRAIGRFVNGLKRSEIDWLLEKISDKIQAGFEGQAIFDGKSFDAKLNQLQLSDKEEERRSVSIDILDELQKEQFFDILLETIDKKIESGFSGSDESRVAGEPNEYDERCSLKSKKTLQCEICKSEVVNLRSHMKSHQDKKLKCDYCEKIYRTNFDRRSHINSAHLAKLEACSTCGKLTANLRKHIYGNHQHSIPCEKCGKTFARQSQLKYHLEAHERGTIVVKADPEILRERKRLANRKYLDKRNILKKNNKELHEHERNLKRIWARKNRAKLLEYKKERKRVSPNVQK